MSGFLRDVQTVRLEPSADGKREAAGGDCESGGARGRASAAAVKKGGDAAGGGRLARITRCRRIPQPERYRCRCGRGRWNISRSWCRYCVRLRMRGSARLQAKFWVMRQSVAMNKLRALVGAARDPDWLVRNNATRALGVLVRANVKLAGGD